MNFDAEVAIIGAGPIGIELAIALKQRGISCFLFDKGQVAQMIFNFPPYTHFFSSNERIGIAGVPIQTVDQQKCPREEYLAYIRSVVMQFGLHVNAYEEIIRIKNEQENGFTLTSRKSGVERSIKVRFVVLSTGGTSTPRMLGVPGEELPHVETRMSDPHCYFQQRVLIVGGKNSAAEDALRLFQAGANVTLAVRKNEIEVEDIKYWLLPELLSRMEKKEIVGYFQTRVVEILPSKVSLENIPEKRVFELPFDFVIKAIGFHSNMELCDQLKVPLSIDQQIPSYNSDTLETPISNVYVLGTVTGGTQARYKIFIENCHEHVFKITHSIMNKLGIQEPSAFPIRQPNILAPNHRLEE